MTLARENFNCSDRQILAQLYKQLRPFALSKTEYLTGSTEVASDIVHDVFTKLWCKKLTFSSAKAAYAWVYVACHNAAIDFLRSQKSSNANGAQHDNMVVEPSTPYDRLANRQIFLRLIHQLTDLEAQILGYRIIDGNSNVTIAGLLDVSERTVERAFARIYQKLEPLRGLIHES